MLTSILRQAVGSRIKRIYLAEQHLGIEHKRCIIYAVFGLIIIEIAILGGCHDDIMTLSRSLETTLRASPTHYRRTGIDITIEDLVPTYNAFATTVQIVFHTLGKPSLQLIACRQPLSLHPLLAQRTCLPSHLRSLIATDMDVF